RLFGKPEVRGERRLGVGLARGNTIEEAVEKVLQVTAAIEVSL
ncbi:MAG TPA: phosphoribosylglycinamide formyltransferase 2, partial [Halieaceae bacterium]|nr:phosphoribosylglycinamide formyltransferase 2 [Halieaceae bacterium]